MATGSLRSQSAGRCAFEEWRLTIWWPNQNTLDTKLRGSWRGPIPPSTGPANESPFRRITLRNTPCLICSVFIGGTFCLRIFIVESASCDLHRSDLSRFLHGCCDPATHRPGRKDTQVRKMGTCERVWGVYARHEGCWTRGRREGARRHPAWHRAAEAVGVYL